MKVKIIKRAEREEIAASPTKADSGGGSEKLGGAATVKSWIDELRRKREEETRLAEKLFGRQFCG